MTRFINDTRKSKIKEKEKSNREPSITLKQRKQRQSFFFLELSRFRTNTRTNQRRRRLNIQYTYTKASDPPLDRQSNQRHSRRSDHDKSVIRRTNERKVDDMENDGVQEKAKSVG